MLQFVTRSGFDIMAKANQIGVLGTLSEDSVRWNGLQINRRASRLYLKAESVLFGCGRKVFRILGYGKMVPKYLPMGRSRTNEFGTGSLLLRPTYVFWTYLACRWQPYLWYTLRFHHLWSYRSRPCFHSIHQSSCYVSLLVQGSWISALLENR